MVLFEGRLSVSGENSLSFLQFIETGLYHKGPFLEPGLLEAPLLPALFLRVPIYTRLTMALSTALLIK